jgi:hypothetical protein
LFKEPCDVLEVDHLDGKSLPLLDGDDGSRHILITN